MSFSLPWLINTSKRDLRSDLEAGIIGGILAFPQAIALAILAGMPPQYGIYASVIPVLVALIFGSSWLTLSGPNTAVSVMLAATILPLASLGSDRFVELIFLLSLFVGLIQLMIGLFKLGVVLDFISSTVILAITQAVAIILLVSAVFSMSLTEVTVKGNIFHKLFTFYNQTADINLGSLIIGVSTILTGITVKILIPRYSLLIAMLVGTIIALLMIKLDSSLATNIPLLGVVPLSLNIWQLPRFDIESMSIVLKEWDNALAIAFLGLMQTVIISRSIALKSGQVIVANREIVGQGLANTIAPFCSAFAGSGSFNRSATNYQAGAKTLYSGIFGVMFLLFIVVLGQSYLGYIPLAVISATLFLVGIGLFDWSQVRQIWLSSAERLIFSLTFGSALLLGLNVGVLVGVFSSLLVYLWRTSQPNIDIVEYLSRNGKLVKSISLDGNLFFGSLPAIEEPVSKWLKEKNDQQILVIKTDHISYIDIPASRFINKFLVDSINENHEAYVYISRESLLESLVKAGLDKELMSEYLIFKDKSHPMKSILYPYEPKRSDLMSDITDPQVLAANIKKTPLMNSFSDESLSSLLENNPPRYAEAGEIIIRRDEGIDEHLILVDGVIEVQRVWSVPGANDKSHTWKLSPQNGIPAMLAAASNGIRVRALSDIQYVLLNAITMDSMLGWMNRGSLSKHTPSTLKLMQKVVATHHFPLEVIEKIVTELTPQKVEAGEIIINEREKGENFYLIEEGEAEVIRTDPFTDEKAVVAQLSAGDCFGEEALIQDAFRNATIRMLTPGLLQVLGQQAFLEHVKKELVKEVSAEKAYQTLKAKEAELIDCRYDMEYEECRIENSTLIPLHELRERIHELDSNKKYLVYCRSGRRSKAAAYLLQERNIEAFSISGGIKDWPYEIIYA